MIREPAHGTKAYLSEDVILRLPGTIPQCPGSLDRRPRLRRDSRTADDEPNRRWRTALS